MPYNFVAGSIHTKKLCSRLSAGISDALIVGYGSQLIEAITTDELPVDEPIKTFCWYIYQNGCSAIKSNKTIVPLFPRTCILCFFVLFYLSIE